MKVGSCIQVILLTSLSLITACGGGGGGSGNSQPSVATNLLPSVSAGDNQMVDEQSTVNLSATATDSEGTISSYAWRQTQGVSVTLNVADTADISFESPVTTEQINLVFEVSVTDNDNGTASDSVSITVNPVNAAPTANAGDDQETSEQTLANLVGRGSDSDGDIVTYLWQQTMGISVEIDDPNQAITTLTTPVTTQVEVLEFELTVTDNEGATASDRLQLQIFPVNQLPEVVMPADESAIEGQTLTVNAQVTDEDGSIESLIWTQVTGTTAAITGSETESPTIVLPQIQGEEALVFHLNATDNEGGTTRGIYVVSVSNYPRLMLNDTGMVECFNFGGGTDCPAQDVPGQDAEFGRDALATSNQLSKTGTGKAGFDWTKLDAEGNDLAETATEWSCIRDNHTGLVWENKSLTDSLHLSTNTYTWYFSDPSLSGGGEGTQNGGACSGSDCDTESFINAVNNQGYCGFNDWRLPSVLEFYSIVNLNEASSGQKVDPEYFPHQELVGGNYHWAKYSGFSTKDFSLYYGSNSTSPHSQPMLLRLVRSNAQ